MPMETSIDLSQSRRLRSIDAAQWLGSGHAHWLEWDHQYEQSRTFADIMNVAVSQNWGRFIKPGCVCIDIGAHSGDTAVPMGLLGYNKRTGQKAKVVAVEPNPDIITTLTATLALNSHVADFVIEQCAVTREDVLQVELADHGNGNCNGGILEGNYSPVLLSHLQHIGHHRYTAKGRSLASIIGSHARPGRSDEIQFIKTDCEGYDQDIIRGASDILQAIKPILFVEWFAFFDDLSDNENFLGAFKDVGYEVLDPLSLKPLEIGQRPHDVVGVHKSRLHELGL